MRLLASAAASTSPFESRRVLRPLLPSSDRLNGTARPQANLQASHSSGEQDRSRRGTPVLLPAALPRDLPSRPPLTPTPALVTLYWKVAYPPLRVLDHPTPRERPQGAHRERARCWRDDDPGDGQGGGYEAAPDPGQRVWDTGTLLLSPPASQAKSPRRKRTSGFCASGSRRPRSRHSRT